jgi:hypothetical protein
MAVNKKRVIKSLENLSEDVKDLIKDQYPSGYESSITRIMNAKKEPIFVFPLETDDAIYLVKVPATKNSDGGYDVESGAPQEFDSGGDDDGVPGAADDNFNSGDSDSEDGFGDDDGGGGKRSSEASYDPDFDN